MVRQGVTITAPHLSFARPADEWHGSAKAGEEKSQKRASLIRLLQVLSIYLFHLRVSSLWYADVFIRASAQFLHT